MEIQDKGLTAEGSVPDGLFERASYVNYKGAVGVSSEHLDDDGHLVRTGGVITGSASIITAVIGAGVLSLAWATAQCGWVAGPVMQLMFASITIYCTRFLVRCYRYPGPYEGERCYTYTIAVRRFLGPNYVLFCGVIQHLNLVCTSVGYTITASLAMSGIHRAICYRNHPGIREVASGNYDYDGSYHYADPGTDTCKKDINLYVIIFSAIELIFVQIPDMDRIWWLSIFSAIMSFTYATIGVGLSIARVVANVRHRPGFIYGTAGGVSVASEGRPTWTWYFFEALGDVAFAYSFSYILIEITDTISGPKEGKKAMKATWVSLLVTSGFYMSIGTIGYAAFGNDAPGNLITGFGFFQPPWLVALACAAIILHLIGGYQVWTQPFLVLVETAVYKIAPKSNLLNAGVTLPLPGRPLKLRYWVVAWRCLYVCIVALISCLLPFFNDILGIMGALGFWPLTVFLPIEMHIVQSGVKRWSPRWIWLQSLSMFCLIVSIAALIGSIAGLVIDTKDYTPFQANY